MLVDGLRCALHTVITSNRATRARNGNTSLIEPCRLLGEVLVMSQQQDRTDVSLDAWAGERLSVSLRGLISAACLIIAVGGIAYLLWDFDAVPKRVVETSTITVLVPGQPSRTVGARIRQIRVPAGRSMQLTWQVQLPGGQWIDCKRDCVRTFRSKQ